MSSNTVGTGGSTGAGVSAAVGNVQKVRNQTSITETVTLVGSGINNITINDIKNQLVAENPLFDAFNIDQLYIYKIRAYGVAGGYLSLAPYPHRQYTFNAVLSGPAPTPVTGFLYNSYQSGADSLSRPSGNLTQMYDIGIEGSTRPTLEWTYPKNEILNNPFTLTNSNSSNVGTESVDGFFDNTQLLNSTCMACSVQSANATGDALYIVQFDVCARSSRQLTVQQALGAGAFGSENITKDNYKRPAKKEQDIEDSEKAYNLANKKRKVKMAKDITLPVRDAE